VSLDFTAIDFETANSYRGSPCSVGVVKVRDGQIVGESAKRPRSSLALTRRTRPRSCPSEEDGYHQLRRSVARRCP
jgi:DNA polymerase III epsilon subunit-like protein